MMPFFFFFRLPIIDCRKKTGEEKRGRNPDRFRTNQLSDGDDSGEERG
jgi:hypothetical protein